MVPLGNTDPEDNRMRSSWNNGRSYCRLLTRRSRSKSNERDGHFRSSICLPSTTLPSSIVEGIGQGELPFSYSISNLGSIGDNPSALSVSSISTSAPTSLPNNILIERRLRDESVEGNATGSANYLIGCGDSFGASVTTETPSKLSRDQRRQLFEEQVKAAEEAKKRAALMATASAAIANSAAEDAMMAKGQLESSSDRLKKVN
ncbi:unnamed protein product [Protopolystoma xenopodis]|uniref:Uncharacterized protein n=1 Tax=Protopolystoma xenopodis TaxID=117903 RepID=A0A3S5AC91_9PLAT|nr:unnamed protein product [Protopolystoma xenopodis]